MRSESERSFDEVQIRRARLQSLGLAYLSPQNKSLAQSFRYMRHKPTIIAFKTPSLENCEQRESALSIGSMSQYKGFIKFGWLVSFKCSQKSTIFRDYCCDNSRNETLLHIMYVLSIYVKGGSKVLKATKSTFLWFFSSNIVLLNLITYYSSPFKVYQKQFK